MGGPILTGLGVRIDYSLFILTRTRTGLRRGLSVEEAVTAVVRQRDGTVLAPVTWDRVRSIRVGYLDDDGRWWLRSSAPRVLRGGRGLPVFPA
jgi:hypothetical protein